MVLLSVGLKTILIYFLPRVKDHKEDHFLELITILANSKKLGKNTIM